MPTRALKVEPRQWWAWLVVALAGVAGLWFGYDFGRQVSGMGLGLLMAANGAVFASLLASAVVDWLFRPKKNGREEG
jgi:drug/metabolite transporter (DMT)-like permease